MVRVVVLFFYLKRFGGFFIRGIFFDYVYYFYIGWVLRFRIKIRKCCNWGEKRGDEIKMI